MLPRPSLPLALAFALAVPDAHAVPYTFTKIAETGDCLPAGEPDDCFVDFGNAAITPTGTVLFQATLESGATGVFSGNGAVLSERATTDDGFVAFGPTPAGTSAVAVFRAETVADDRDLWRQADVLSPPLLVADVGNAGDPVVNEDGVIAYLRTAERTPLAFPSVEWLAAGRGPRRITQTLGEGASGLESYSDPAINDRGEVAFVTDVPLILSRAAWVTRASPEGARMRIATSQVTFPVGASLIDASRPSINDAGTVAFLVGADTNPSVQTGNGGPRVGVAGADGDYDSFSGVGITDAGLVVFGAALDIGGSGIYVGPDRLADKVIEIGDSPPPIGSPVFVVRFVGPGLNDAAQIAFVAELQDGTVGVYRAEPVGQPPSLVVGDFELEQATDDLVLESIGGFDPNDPPVMFEWDLDGDGDADWESEGEETSVPAAVHAQLLTPGLNPILLRVTTLSGFYATAWSSVTLPTPCSNGGDDDEDEQVDFPDDTGCRSALDLSEEPDCSDGLDQDGDGLFDYPADPGCADADGAVEDPACDDGFDQDGDTLVDADDPDCEAPFDPVEGPDPDSDGMPDYADNCTEAPNPAQRDTDGDGYGNACDPDYDGNEVVGIADFNVLRSGFGSQGEAVADLDHDGDGVVGIPDFNVFRSHFGGAPGPSGLLCAGIPPCGQAP